MCLAVDFAVLSCNRGQSLLYRGYKSEGNLFNINQHGMWLLGPQAKRLFVIINVQCPVKSGGLQVLVFVEGARGLNWRTWIKKLNL